MTTRTHLVDTDLIRTLPNVQRRLDPYWKKHQQYQGLEKKCQNIKYSQLFPLATRNWPRIKNHTWVRLGEKICKPIWNKEGVHMCWRALACLSHFPSRNVDWILSTVEKPVFSWVNHFLFSLLLPFSYFLIKSVCVFIFFKTLGP